jgi:hypothetical protein
MKIIVYNYKDQFALSRKQIEKIKGIMPKEYFAPILEFHLTFDTSKLSIFEYSYETKQAFFAFPVKEKTPEALSKAVEELLIGLARIKAKSRFGEPLEDRERSANQTVVEKWHGRCLEAIMAEGA